MLSDDCIKKIECLTDVCNDESLFQKEYTKIVKDIQKTDRFLFDVYLFNALLKYKNTQLGMHVFNRIKDNPKNCKVFFDELDIENIEYITDDLCKEIKHYMKNYNDKESDKYMRFDKKIKNKLKRIKETPVEKTKQQGEKQYINNDIKGKTHDNGIEKLLSPIKAFYKDNITVQNNLRSKNLEYEKTIEDKNHEIELLKKEKNDLSIKIESMNVNIIKLEENISVIERKLAYNEDCYKKELKLKEEKFLEDISNRKKNIEILKHQKTAEKDEYVNKLKKSLEIRYSDYKDYSSTDNVNLLKTMLDNVFRTLSENGIDFD